MAERLTQTEQLVTQLKEMIREKDAALRAKDDQLKVRTLPLLVSQVLLILAKERGQCLVGQDIRHVKSHDDRLLVYEINMRIDLLATCSTVIVT